MIPGTKQYKGAPARVPDKPASDCATSNVSASLANETTSETAQPTLALGDLPASPNQGLSRRAWFSSIVPALGEGLVKGLRQANQLSRDIKEIADTSND